MPPVKKVRGCIGRWRNEENSRRTKIEMSSCATCDVCRVRTGNDDETRAALQPATIGTANTATETRPLAIVADRLRLIRGV